MNSPKPIQAWVKGFVYFCGMQFTIGFRLALMALCLLSSNGIHAQFSSNLKQLASMMHGSYSSEAQSKADTTYFDIRLKIIPIWANRTDALWMYVEQAVAAKVDKPYRQRVYRLTERNDGTFESAVFTLKSPLRFAGKPELVEQLHPDSLTLRDGCSVIMKKEGKKKFTGATERGKCPSDLKNAAYASSVVTITKNMLLSWDQGFDSNGNQVWGATKGGYMFRKLKSKK